MKKASNLLRQIGAGMMLLQAACVCVPFYYLNPMLLVALGLREGEMGLEFGQSMTQVAEILQKREGISSFEIMSLCIGKKAEKFCSIIAEASVKNEVNMQSGLILIIAGLFILPFSIRLIGGVLSLIRKEKKVLVIFAILNFIMSMGVVGISIAMYNDFSNQLRQTAGNSIAAVESAMATVGGNSDIVSYFIGAEIGFYILPLLSVVTLIMAFCCGRQKDARPVPAAKPVNAPKPEWEKPPQMNSVQPQVVTRAGEPKGIIRGINGLYAGAEINLNDGKIIIGRDASRANLVYDDSCAKVSRKHCELSYNPQTKAFIIIDYSSNGTFKNENPNCLPQNMPISLEAGSVIDIGDETNRFILE